MKLIIINSVLQSLTVAIALIAIVFTSGIIWRVEKKIDTAYKLFLVAIIFFILAQLTDFFDTGKLLIIPSLHTVFNLVFIILLLAGILETRSAIRHIDGEITTE